MSSIFHLSALTKLVHVLVPSPQSKQRGQLGKNFGYAILGLIVVSGLSSGWQHGDSLHAIYLYAACFKWYWIHALFYFMYFIGYKALEN